MTADRKDDPVTEPLHGIFPGVDRASLSVAFAGALRDVGVAVGMSEIAAFCAGLGAAVPTTRDGLYWVARITLVRRAADVGAFDDAFARVFAGGALRLDPAARRRTEVAAHEPHRRRPPGPGGPPLRDGGDESLPWSTPSGGQLRAVDAGADAGARGRPEPLPSALAGRAEVPFPELDPADLRRLDEWLETAMRRWPTRRSRRLRPDRGGRRIALRHTLARARRTGFEPARLVRTKPVRRRRRIVMLCDVSRSMQPFVTAYLHLLRSAAVAADAEVFAFAATLTRLTPVLTHASAETAVDLATATVSDRFGGTRIAGSIAALLASRHGDACRGAIVLVASDGWDSDPPEELARAMARLRRRAHRLVWLNPRCSAPGFAPLTGGMAAALPYCDDVLAGDSVAAMADVVSAIVRT